MLFELICATDGLFRKVQVVFQAEKIVRDGGTTAIVLGGAVLQTFIV